MIQKLTFWASDLHQSEPANYGGQFPLSTQLIKANFHEPIQGYFFLKLQNGALLNIWHMVTGMANGSHSQQVQNIPG